MGEENCFDGLDINLRTPFLKNIAILQIQDSHIL